MNRSQFCIATAALVAGTAGDGQAAGERSSGRALWVWHTALGESSAVAAFAAANAFGRVFFSIPRDDRAAVAAGDPGTLGALAVFRRQNILLYGVAGDPAWVKRKRTEPPSSVGELLTAHRRHGVFDGIALDVEPHTLPEWKAGTDKTALGQGLIDVLEIIGRAAKAHALPVVATVHPTYAKVPLAASSQTLLQGAARAVDASVLMAYRNAPNTLASFGGPAMEQLAQTNTSWWLGVSTHTDAPAGTSYASLPARAFFPAIDATAADLRRRYGDSFAGIAVEDYRNTTALLNGRTAA
jgi:hypothetical protein